MLRKAEAAYWLNLFENANSPGDFWKVTNRILKKNKIKQCGPIQDKNGNIITRSEQKAGYFNDFFLNIALDLTRNLSPLPSDTTTFIYKVYPTMSSFSVELDECRRLFRNPSTQIKQWVWITFPQETLRYVSPLLYKGSLKFV